MLIGAGASVVKDVCVPGRAEPERVKAGIALLLAWGGFEGLEGTKAGRAEVEWESASAKRRRDPTEVSMLIAS